MLRMPPPGNREAAHAGCRVEGPPESQKGTKREWKEDAVAAADARRLIDPRPTVDHPSPTLRSIQPAHRPAGGAAGLVEAGVTLQRVGQVGCQTADLRLIVDNLRLESERDVAGEFCEGLRRRLSTPAACSLAA